jgi:predicted secreted protein
MSSVYKSYAEIAKVASASSKAITVSPVEARREAARKEQARLAALAVSAVREMTYAAAERETQRKWNDEVAALKTADKARRSAVGPYVGALCEHYRSERQLATEITVLRGICRYN